MKKKNKYRPLPDYLTIQPSKIEGLGLFAIKDIPAYEVIGMTHAKWYGEPNNLLRTPLGGFINHEPLVYNNMEEKKELSGPNCEKIKSRPDGAKTEWNLVTRKDIKSGEELTVHYTFYKPE